ncbi:MAG: sensor histidine kinase, partial [Actinomycetota bacterium]|nr:sensor histidine kinase [Actinomycetota bacterium]
LETAATVYFCCLEAMQNVAKYAHATSARVTLAMNDDELVFRVDDDGTGFDVRTTPHGSGLRNMADRVAAGGGELEVTSVPGEGTSVIGRVAVRALEAAP